MKEELMELLTHRVRVLSVEQAEKSLSTTPLANRESLLELEAAGLVMRQELLARPALPVLSPVCSWTPGDKRPEFGKIAYQLKIRWTAAAVPVELLRATHEARKQWGGYLGGRWPRASETSHDLSLAAVFLWHRQHRPEDAAAWIPEAQLYAEGRGRQGRLPDAIIRREGKDQRIVEFGGAYGKQKLAGFHSQMCDLPYEIW